MQEFIDFMKSFPVRAFSKGESLPVTAWEKTTLYAIQTGFVKVSSYDSSGNQQFIFLKGRLDIVPSERLFSSRVSDDYFYEALTDVTAYEIEKAVFLKFAKENLLVMTEIARSMSSHYDDLLLRLRATEQTTIRSKLIHTLYQLATKLSSEQRVELHKLGLQLTHNDIAQLIGSTRETTTLELRKLKNERVIDYSRTEFTVDIEKIGELL